MTRVGTRWKKGHRHLQDRCKAMKTKQDEPEPVALCMCSLHTHDLVPAWTLYILPTTESYCKVNVGCSGLLTLDQPIGVRVPVPQPRPHKTTN